MLHGIDPGRKLGFATWGTADVPHVRLWDLAAESEGAMYSRLRLKLNEVVSAGDTVGIEAQIIPKFAKGGSSIQSRLPLFGIRAHVILVAYERKARVVEISSSEWRSKFIGVTQAPAVIKGSEPRRRWIKGKAVAECRARGWGDVGEDEAEALGILHCLRCQIDSEYADRGTLFAR